MNTMKELLRVENLHTSFFTHDGEVKAVKGVDFHIGEGETLGIVGESGSGKSVTSLSILDLLPPAGRVVDGGVWLGDKNLVEADRAELRNVRGGMISMIFQDPMSSLNPLIPVGSQVEEMILTHEKRTRAQVRDQVLELFEMVQIPDAARRYKSYPHEFSGGQRQRICVARALALNPKLIIADEPVSALDVSIQAQILNLLVELQGRFSLTYLFISHDLSVVRHICDRVAVMYLGRIVELTDSAKLFARPLHAYTQALLSAVPATNPHKKGTRIHLEGEVPSQINPPKGCAFHPRCMRRGEICAREVPALMEAEPGHFVACHEPQA